MALPNIFTKEVSDQLIQRINSLNPSTVPLWGKMSVDQMLAHVNIAYEMAIDNTHPKPIAFKRWLLKTFVKNGVVNEVPYKKNSPTAPAFIIKGNRDFDQEKNRLVAYLNKTLALGEKYFDQKESLSFGTMNITEWNNLFYKHIDHHLSQFGV
jgi:hypothetical protein